MIDKDSETYRPINVEDDAKFVDYLFMEVDAPLLCYANDLMALDDWKYSIM